MKLFIFNLAIAILFVIPNSADADIRSKKTNQPHFIKVTTYLKKPTLFNNFIETRLIYEFCEIQNQSNCVPLTWENNFDRTFINLEAEAARKNIIASLAAGGVAGVGGGYGAALGYAVTVMEGYHIAKFLVWSGIISSFAAADVIVSTLTRDLLGDIKKATLLGDIATNGTLYVDDIYDTADDLRFILNNIE